MAILFNHPARRPGANAAPPVQNYALRLPGGTNAINAKYGQGPQGDVLNLGSNWAMEIRHRTTTNNAQYLFCLGANSNQLAIIRGFVPNRYEIYSQGPSGQIVRLADPDDTVVGPFYTIRAESDNGMVRLKRDGQLIASVPLAYVFPNSGGSTFLRLGTYDPQYGSDYGDYDYALIEKDGQLLCRYDMTPTPGTQQVPDSAGNLTDLFVDGSFILLP